MYSSLIRITAAILFCLNVTLAWGQTPSQNAVLATDTVTDAQSDSLDAALEQSLDVATDTLVAPVENMGLHQSLKTKFIEGNAGFMSLVALALVLGLAFCIERILYLTLADVDTKKMLLDVDARIAEGDIDGAKSLCRDTRGPVASVCYQGLMRAEQPMDEIERSMVAYGAVQSAKLESGCSWITMFIAIAPSLGFLGTVIGMVMAFDQIQNAGDISPTIVASGMKVALITTIFGIIAALILQVFYNYILTKIERITAQMEEAVIVMLDALSKRKAQS